MLRARINAAWVLLMGVAALGAGCNSLMNAWLEPIHLGTFGKTDQKPVMEIRTSLSIEDTPFGISGAEYPTKEDLIVYPYEHPISPGDSLLIEIYELRMRGLPSQSQVRVSPTGLVNLPVLGWVRASEYTVREFETSLVEELKNRQILMKPEVTVSSLFLEKGTYSIFGIGASAASNAPLRAGTFPLRRPDTRLLEAINNVGGLSEFVTDIYIFRYEDVEPEAAEAEPEFEPSDEAATAEQPEAESQEAASQRVPDSGEVEEPEPAGEAEATDGGLEAELIEAVVSGNDEPESQTEMEVPPELEAEPTQPWIWLNGEFVPNPAYSEGEQERRARAEPPVTFESPRVNWARVAGESTFRTIRVPADALRTGDPEFNIVIRPGDVIRIISGEIGIYYVMGQVQRPGAFGFNAEEITLKRAIAIAGGLAALAWPDRCTIYRRIGQREQMIQVDLDRIFAGKEPDFTIRRGDIINVGTHPLAPFLQRLRAWTLPTPANTVGYSFSYARNFADIDSYGSRRNPHNEPDRFPNLFP